MRKSPIKHTVRTYKRQGGKTVNSYERGHGEKKHKVSRPQLHKTQQNTTNKYLVHINYTNLPVESFPVTASSYPEAIEIALSIRTHITPPFQIVADKQ